MDKITDEQIVAYFDTIPDVVAEMGLSDGWEPVIREVCRRVGIRWESVRAILFPEAGPDTSLN